MTRLRSVVQIPSVAWSHEIDQRAERRRRAAIATIIETVDQAHCLDDLQRAAVTLQLMPMEEES